MKLKLLPVFLYAFLIVSCQAQWGNAESNSAEEVADSFAVYYFNWQFDKAAKFVTENSMVWLRYAASQVHQADIDILREKCDSRVKVEDVELDDYGYATVTVTDFLRMDTIGTEGHLVKEARFKIPLEQSAENGKRRWKVKMEGLPQSEKRNRD